MVERVTRWMKHDKAFAPLRRVVKQRNFYITESVENLSRIAPEGLVKFSQDLGEIIDFLDRVHEKAIIEAMGR